MNTSLNIEEKVFSETPTVEIVGLDANFGGVEGRKRQERNLVWKLDCRMSILLVIYILNYVGPHTCSNITSF